MTAASFVCLKPETGSHGDMTSPLRYSIAIADRHNARNDLSRRYRIYYQVSTVTVPRLRFFKPGDRLQPVCLMIMSYKIVC